MFKQFNVSGKILALTFGIFLSGDLFASSNLMLKEPCCPGPCCPIPTSINFIDKYTPYTELQDFGLQGDMKNNPSIQKPTT